MDTFTEQSDAWWQSLLGKAVLAAQIQVLEPIFAQLFGYHLLQLGGPAQILPLPCAITHQFRLAQLPSAGAQVVGEYQQLPVAPASLDAIFLHHVLEFNPAARGLLTQCQQALVNGGKLIIVGFNPYSLWGLAKCFSRSTHFPLRGRWRSRRQVVRELHRLDLVVQEQHGAFFRPPVTQSRLLNRLLFLEVLGAFLSSRLAASYIIVAEKKSVPLNPLVQGQYVRSMVPSASVSQVSTRMIRKVCK